MKASVLIQVALVSGSLGVVYALLNAVRISRSSEGSEKMQALAGAIRAGVNAFIKREYLAVFVVATLIYLLLLTYTGQWSAIGFIIGVISAALTAYLGAFISGRANVRTAEAAQAGLKQAAAIAFRGSFASGALVAGISLLSVTLSYLAVKSLAPLSSLSPDEETFRTLVGLMLGGSTVSVFARITGGIYAKSADVGADLVSKVETYVPENDARNAAVIADSVGDHIVDNAGLCADLYETATIALVAAMLIAGTSFGTESPWVEFPLLIGGIGVISTLFAAAGARLGKRRLIIAALYRSALLSSLVTATALYFASDWFAGLSLIQPSLPAPIITAIGAIGLILTWLIIGITEYYTSKGFAPVKRIAAASESGHATNIIAGLSVSMKSTVLPVAAVIIAIAGAYFLGGGFAASTGTGLFAIALALVGMTSMAGVVTAIGAYGPIADNAESIAEITGLSEETRIVTQSLDAAGKTTKAIAKGYAISAAGLAALLLFIEYAHAFSLRTFDLVNPAVLSGLFIGGLLPYLFGSLLLAAVARTAGRIVEETLTQFRDIPGIWDGSTPPDYRRCISIATNSAILQTLVPILFLIATPVAVYALFEREALGGLMIGTLITGLLQAISLTSGGGAWDNAKEYIESGMFGGKRSLAHIAAVTGDTVGDPCKDTVGPAIAPIIKIIAVVSLLTLIWAPTQIS
jgi:K(+)-stimulated pyrophosphate-energized sodium pump